MIEIDMSFYQHCLVLVGIIIGLTVFKVASCKPFNECGEDFDWVRLLEGLGGNLIILAGLAITYYLGSRFGGDVSVITLNDTTVTIQSALDIMMLVAIGAYGAKLVNNFTDFFRLGNEANQVLAARRNALSRKKDKETKEIEPPIQDNFEYNPDLDEDCNDKVNVEG